MKTKGGLTHGQGLSESTVSKWVHCTPACTAIIEALENFTGISAYTSDEHVEFMNLDRGEIMLMSIKYSIG